MNINVTNTTSMIIIENLKLLLQLHIIIHLLGNARKYSYIKHSPNKFCKSFIP